jgi:hypothetical protein
MKFSNYIQMNKNFSGLLVRCAVQGTGYRDERRDVSKARHSALDAESPENVL